MRIGALDLFGRQSNGDLKLAGWHPRSSQTWHWYVSISRAKHWVGWAPSRDHRRTGQWHDYYRIPLIGMLIIGRQDYHKQVRP